ncbi:cytochrome P450 [Rhizodiscina lignyota]|uniref:Cytochrome P450 n=1 Tax=Rhizodiscina lignyota TaxID=1504668 RepID=A0A9P4MBU4_9PEZI|nr:cytochrome P450 [Rhizodiscina lignyota]
MGLSSLPGPFLARFTNVWRLWHMYRSRYASMLVEVHDRYGDYVLLGPNLVSTRDPEVIEALYGLRSETTVSDMFKVMQSYVDGVRIPTLMTSLKRDEHDSLRKPIARAYAMTSVLSYENIIDSHIRRLVDQLNERFVTTNRVCDMSDWLQYYAFDVVCDLTMSKNMGFVEHGHDVEDMIAQLDREWDYRAYTGVMPFLDKAIRKNKLAFLWKGKGNPFFLRARQLLDERLENNTNSERQHDILDEFLEASEKHPNVVTKHAIVGLVGQNLLAGSDTTSAVLKSVIYYVLKDPSITERLRNEIDDASLQYPVEFSKAQGLPYLSACIEEGLRMHPVAAVLVERVLPQSGLTLPNGKKLSAGTVVGMSPWTMRGNKAVFGEDASTFNPDRWLPQLNETTEEYNLRIRTMRKSGLAFSYGPRSCIGQHIAKMEIWKLIPTIFGHFELELANPEVPWDVQERFFAKQSGIKVFIRPRKHE